MVLSTRIGYYYYRFKRFTRPLNEPLDKPAPVIQKTQLNVNTQLLIEETVRQCLIEESQKLKINN